MDSSSRNTRYGRKLSTFRKHKKCCAFLCVVLGLVVVVIILLIVGFTVFKPKHAVTTVNSVELNGIKVDIHALSVDLNVSLSIDLTVKNPNRVSFRYGNSSALLYYRGTLVGEAAIPAGKISSRETKEMNVTLVIMADRLVSNSSLYSDVIAGTVPLNTTTRVSGRVTVLRLFKHHVVSYTYCNLPIDVRNRTVGMSGCRYKTKL